jgi:DME family drug/metabolite transporter
LVYMAAVLAGICLFMVGTQPAMATAPDPGRGNEIALVSGVTYAFMLVGLRWLSRYAKITAGLAAASLGNVLAFVCALPLALPVRHAGPADVLVLLYLGIVQIGLAYLCLTRALRHVPGVEATTLLMIEPALNPVWSWLVHGERPGVLPLAGGAVIVTASLVNTWRRALRDGARVASPRPL